MNWRSCSDPLVRDVRGRSRSLTRDPEDGCYSGKKCTKSRLGNGVTDELGGTGGGLRGRTMMRSHLLIAMTALVILAIEWSRQLGTILPIPFLLLYASVVASGGMGGILAGGISGALATAFIGYAAMIGFGPPTLTGGELQAFLGMALYLGTGLLLGRVRDQRNRFERQTREHEASLQERIAQLTGQFAAILYNAPMAIFLKDRDGRFQFVNRRFAEWYGVAEQDAVGKTSHDIFPAEMADAYVAQDREVTETRAVLEREHEIVFADGSRHPIVVTKFPVLDATGDFIGIGTCNIDVTDRHLAEERLARPRRWRPWAS